MTAASMTKWLEFNLNSRSSWVRPLKLGLPAARRRRPAGPPTPVLEELADDYPIVGHPRIPHGVKLKSTYCDGLVKVIAEDGRIH